MSQSFAMFKVDTRHVSFVLCFLVLWCLGFRCERCAQGECHGTSLMFKMKLIR